MAAEIAGGRIKRGDVIVSLNHVFDDTGDVAPKKFLVILGCRNGNLLYFVATSKEKFGRQRVLGCTHKVHQYDSTYHLNPPKQKTGKWKAQTRRGFAIPTWIVLAPCYWPEGDLIKRLDANQCYYDFSLSEDEYNGVRKCFLGGPESAPIHSEF